MKSFLYKLLFFCIIIINLNSKTYANEINNAINKNQEDLFTQSENIENKDFIEKNEDKIETSNITDLNKKIEAILKNSNVYKEYAKIPKYDEFTTETNTFTSKNKKYLFENGDTFKLTRINFKKNIKDRFQVNIPIYGKNLMVRYIDNNTKQWVATGNLQNLQNIKNTTIFVDTDTHSYIFSVPAVYKNDFKNNTLTIERNEELGAQITKKDDIFTFNISFPQNINLISEYWYIEAKTPLVKWDKDTLNILKTHDLALERRWSYDGYYFITPSNYVPSGKDILYRHPANYTGAYFIKTPINNLFKELGYIMTKTSMLNQNKKGYWETGPKSQWLSTDFGIGENFYDTRFSTDFAVSLLHGYQVYGDKEFLKSAILYGEFFLNYAKNNSYKIENGGILVQDYSWEGVHEPTHVSLNHHLAELNFLYELYYITNEKPYLELANQMISGVENTKEKWILPDKNLNYALYYTKNTNKMIDYPFLTYNDLYHTRYLITKIFQSENLAIQYLMDNKKYWMDRNLITEYKKDE